MPRPLISFVLAILLAPSVSANIRDQVSLSAVLGSSETVSKTAPVVVYRWSNFPSIVILDTIDLGFQNRMFSRMAYFLEKRGYRGKLLSNAQLSKLHGWNAHDYSAQEMAEFFSEAHKQGFRLNPEELDLRTFLINNGILRESPSGYTELGGGILSISRESSKIDRRLLLSHESFHGVFFASPEFQGYAFKVWDSLSPQTKDFFEGFLDEMGYDSSWKYLTVNEFQAYLLQLPEQEAVAYLERMERRFGNPKVNVPVESLVDAIVQLRGYWKAVFGTTPESLWQISTKQGTTR
jgi:hypothetical protein